MMGFGHLAILALGATQAWTASAEQVKRQDATAKYCPGGTPICFSEYSVDSAGVVYRIAIPDVKAAPFDILLQIVAPKTVGWAAIGWGGKMTNNPLTLGWPNGNTAIVSSRWTSGKSLPGAYTGAKYTILPTTTSNTSHWQLDVLCQGCSKWQGGELNPNGANALAWAKNTRAVITPSSNTSNFAGHDARGIFSHDLSQAKIPQGIFDAVAYDLENTAPAAPTSAAVVPALPSVATSVVTLPRPVSSSNPQSSVLGPLPIPTRLTVLPGPEPATTSRTARVITSVTQLVPRPGTSTVYVIPSPKPITTVITVIVTARPPTTTVRVTPTPTPTPWQPPNQGGGGGWGGGGGGGGGWGGGGGGGGWGGKGKGGGGRGGGGGGRGGGPGRGRRPGEEGEEE